MKHSEKLHLSNGYFSFKAMQYDTYLSQEMSDEDTIIHNLKIKSKNEVIKYEFCDKDGLTQQGKKDIIGKILSLDTNNDEKIEEFVKTYGYLFNINAEKYTLININSLRKALEYYKYFYELTNAIEKKEKNYTTIVDLICKLLLTDPKIKDDGYYTHPFSDVWVNTDYEIPISNNSHQLYNIDNKLDIDTPHYGVVFLHDGYANTNGSYYIMTHNTYTNIDETIYFGDYYSKEDLDLHIPLERNSQSATAERLSAPNGKFVVS